MTKNLKKVLLSIFIGVALMTASVFVSMASTSTSQREVYASTESVDLSNVQNDDLLLEGAEQTGDLTSTDPEYRPDDDVQATARVAAYLNGGTFNAAISDDQWVEFGSDMVVIDKTVSGSYTSAKVIATLPYVTRPGYNLKGWDTSPSATTVVKEPSSSFIEYPTPMSYVNFYAVWEIATYKITFNNNNVNNGVADYVGMSAFWYKYNTNKYYSDSSCTTVITSITTPLRWGYTFGGYYTGMNGNGTQYVDASGQIVNSLYTKTSSATLYPKWTISDYYVNFDYNDGSNNPNLITSLVGNSGNGTYDYITSSWTATAKSGNTYGYVKTQKYNGSTLVAQTPGFSSVGLSNKITITKDSSWNRLRIGFNGSTIDSVFSVDCTGLTDGQNYTLSYTLTSLGSGAGNTGKITNIKLEEGSSKTAFVEPIKVNHGSTYGTFGTLPTPTREGYTFDGWVNNYFNVVDFANYYKDGNPGEICEGVTQINENGELILCGSSNYYKDSSGEWTAEAYPIYLTAGTYTLSADAYWTGGNEGERGTYLRIVGGPNGDEGVVYLDVNSATKKHYSETFTISTSGTYYIYGSWYHSWNTYYKNIQLTREDGAKWQDHTGDTTSDYITSARTVKTPFNHTLVAKWSAKKYGIYGQSFINGEPNGSISGTGSSIGSVGSSQMVHSNRPTDQGYKFENPTITIYDYYKDGSLYTIGTEELVESGMQMSNIESLEFAYYYYTMSGSKYEQLNQDPTWIGIYVEINWTKTAKTYTVTGSKVTISNGATPTTAGTVTVASSGTFDEALEINVTAPEQFGYNFELSVNIYQGMSTAGTKIAELDSVENGYTMTGEYYSEIFIEVVWDMTALKIDFETNTFGSIKFESNNRVVTEGEYAQEITITSYPPITEGYNYSFIGLKIYGKTGDATLDLLYDSNNAQEGDGLVVENLDGSRSYKYTMSGTYYDTLLVEDDWISEANSFTIIFDKNSNDATGTTASVIATYDNATTLTLNEFTRVGYTFAGWAESSTGEIICENGETLEDTKVNALYNSVGGGTKTLYAVWTAKTATVNIKNLSGTATEGSIMGESDGDYTNTYNIGETITLTHGTGNYQFVKWVKGTNWDADQITSSYTITAQDAENGTVEIRACYQYVLKAYVVTNYVANSSEGGLVSVDTSATSGVSSKPFGYSVGGYENILYAQPNAGYIFAGWFKTSACDGELLGSNTEFAYNVKDQQGWGANSYTFDFYALFVRDISSSDSSDKQYNVFEVRINQNLVYNGSEQVLLEVIDSDGIDNNIYYSIGTPLDITNYSTQGSTDLPKGTAGVYEVYYYAPVSLNYLELKGYAEVEIEVSVDLNTSSKLENIFEVRINQNLVYNGSEQVLLEVIDSDGIANNIYYSIGTELTVENFTIIGSTDLPKGTAGTYVVYFYAPASDNYRQLYDFAEVTIKVPDDLNDGKLDNIVTIVVKENLTYTSYPQVLIESATDLDGIDNNIYFCIGTELTVENFIAEGSTAFPKGTQGEYVIYYYVPASDNYKEAKGSVTAYIKGVESTLTIVLGKDGTEYDGETSIAGVTGDIATIATPTLCGYTFDNWVLGGGGTFEDGVFTFGTGNATLTAVWTANSYTIAFEANGGSGTMSNQTFTFDSDQNLKTNAFTRVEVVNEETGETKEYKFAGWAWSEDATKTVSTDLSVCQIVPLLGYCYNNGATITLVAQWTENFYTAVIMEQEISETVSYVQYSTQFVNVDERTEPYLIFSELQYLDYYNARFVDGGIEFVKASLTQNGEEITEFELNEQNSVTVYFYFSRSQHTLTYNPNGGSVATESRTLYYEQQYGTLPTPTREGYECIGWYSSATASDETKLGMPGDNCTTQMGTQDVTIYAHWEICNYDLKIDLNEDGDNNISTPNGYHFVTHNGQYKSTITIANPTRTGYLFDAWVLTGEDREEAYGDLTNGKYTFGAGNDILTATWIINEYTLTLDLNEDQDKNISTPDGYIPVAYIGNYEESRTIENPTMIGYTFIGWELASEGGGIAYGTLNQTIDSEGNVVSAVYTFGAGNDVLTAMWEQNVYTLTVDANGGMWNGTSPIEGNYSQSTDPIADPTRDGYEFAGWEISGEGNLLEDGNGNSVFTFGDGNATITAQWEIITYTIGYELNGGEWVAGATYVTSYTVKDTVKLPTKDDIIRNGYDFIGWFEDQQLSGVMLEGLAKGSTGNRTFYAKWSAVNYTLTWNGNAPSGASLAHANLWNYAGNIGYTSDNPGEKYLYETTATTASYVVTYNSSELGYISPIPLISGYTLNGWYTESTGGDKVVDVDGSFVNVNGYVENGKWIRAQETILYAQYSAKTYSITYNYNGGTSGNTAPSSYDMTYQSSNVAIPTKEGYSFIGWDVTATLDKQNLASFITVVATNESEQDTVVQAYSSTYGGNAVFYEMFYLAEGVTYQYIDTDNTTVENISWKTFKADVPYIESYSNESNEVIGNNKFAIVWFESNTSETVTIGFNLGATEIKLSDCKLLGDLEFTAKWKADICELTVDPNGGTWGGTTAQTTIEGVIGNTQTIDDPERIGYDFAGWILTGKGSFDNSTKVFTFGAGAATLTAEWDAQAPIITIEGQPSTTPTTEVVVSYGKTDVVFTSTVTHDLPVSYQWYQGLEKDFAINNATQLGADTTLVIDARQFNAGTYYIKCLVTSTNNESATSNEIKLVIEKCENVFSVDVATGLIYNGQPQTLLTIIDSNDKENDVYYVVDIVTDPEANPEVTENVSPSSNSVPQVTNDGLYKVYFSVAETDNYLGLNGSVYVNIDPLYTTLTIDPNGGTYGGELVVEDKNFTELPIVNPERAGWDFDGWELVGGGTFVDGKYVFGLANGTLTAKWKGIEYTITLDLTKDKDENTISGAIFEGDLTSKVIDYSTMSTSQTFTLPVATRNGYTFSKWTITTNSQKGGSVVSGDLLTIPENDYGNILIYAEWTLNTDNTVSIDANGGTITEGKDSYSYAPGTPITISPLPTVVYPGYQFAGWEITIPADWDSKGLEASNTELKIPATMYGAIKLVAQWESNSYTIAYNPNEGRLAEGEQYITLYQTSTTSSQNPITLPLMERDGYTFAGWTFETGENANTTPASKIEDGKLIITDNAYGNVSLIATWSGVEYTINYILNNGTIADNEVYDKNYTTQCTIESEVKTLPTPTRDGYIFKGWAIIVPTDWESKGLEVVDNKLNIPANVYGDITLSAQWEGITYNIVLDPNGGSVTPTSKTYQVQETDLEAIDLPTPERGGYNFNGWAITAPADWENKGLSVEDNKLNISANAYGDITLTAQWVGATDNTITLDANSGIWEEGKISTIAYETKNSSQGFDFTTDEYRPTRAGYTFNGWLITTNSQGGVAYLEKSDAPGYVLTIPANAYGNIILTAQWGVVTYNITYVRYDGVWAEEYTPTHKYTIETTEITLPTAENISKTGYTFAGWYDTADDVNETGIGNQVTANDIIGSTGDKMLYAKWTINQYTLTIDLNEGTWADGTLIPSSYTQDYNTTLTIADPVRTGYTFAGWELTGLGFNDTTKVFTFVGNATLKATWNIDSYTLTVDPVGGEWKKAQTEASSTSVQTITKEYGKSHNILDPVKSGYNFTGWTFEGEGSFNADTKLFTFGAGDATLTANWSKNSYTVYIDFDGGEWADGTQTPDLYTQEFNSTITIENPVREGYTFDGWYLTDENGNISNGSLYDTTYTFGAGNDKLTATWIINKYILTIDPNGGLWNGSAENNEIKQDFASTLIIDNPTREGYTFEGWSTPEYGTLDGTTYTFGAGDAIIVASWTPNNYTLTVDPNGGTWRNSSNPTNVTGACDSTITIEEPIRAGYTFSGWTLTDRNGNTSNHGAEYTFVPGNETLTANWLIVGNNVILEYNGGTESFLKDSTGSYVDYTYDIVDAIGTTEKINATSALSTTTKFNTANALSVNITSANGKVAYVNNNMPTGSYKFSAYVNASALGKSVRVIIEYIAIDNTITGLVDITKTDMDKDIWYYVEDTFTVTTAGKVCLYIYGDVGTYYLDDIKIVRTDNYTLQTSFSYTIETPLTQLPYAVKAGYTFLGWNTASDGTGTYVTTYGNYTEEDLGGKKFYAVYTLSNPTVTTTVDNDTIVYGGDSATLTAIVNTEGLAVDTTTYQWYVSTARDSGYTAITGATSATYVTTTQDAGTYYYRCEVTTTKNTISSDVITSTASKVVVEKGTPNATITMSGYTYAGTVSQPNCTENISGGAITYYYNTTNSTIGGIEWKDITPKTLSVGTYYMYATIGETNNYNAGYSNIVEFIISKATIIIEFSADGNESGTIPNVTYTSVYDTNGLTATITSSVNATLTYSANGGDETSLTAGVATALSTATNAGTFIYNYTVSADNYESISGILTLVVEQLSREVQWEAEDSYIYTGADQSSKVKAYIFAVDGTTKLYCDIEFDNQFINVGSYTATATINNTNYTLTNNTKTISIVKAENAFTINVAQGLVYNAKAQELLEVIDNNDKENDVYYSIGTPLDKNNYDNTAIASTDKPTATNAGTYNVYFYVPATDSYLETSGSMGVVIDQYDLANVTIADIPQQPFTGNAVEPKPIVSAIMDGETVILTENVDFKFMYSNNTNATDEAVLTITPVANGNYKGIQTVNFTIKGEFVTIPTLGEALIYNGTEQTANITTGDLYTITGNTATNAGTYTATIALKDKVNYAWNNEGHTKDDITITWEILKADVTLALDKTSISVRLGESDTIGATITLTDVVGNIDGNALTISGASAYASFSATDIASNKSTITVTPISSTSQAQTVTVKYAGDNNHNASNEVTFTLEVPPTYVNIVVNGNTGGTGSVSGTVANANNEIAIGSNIKFTATPTTGYGLIKYSVQGNTTYMGADNTRELTDVFVSDEIEINDTLLNGEDTLTITLYFDEVVTIDMDLDTTDTGSTGVSEAGIATTYENNTVNSKYTYNAQTENNELQAFKSASVKFDVEATQIDGQYYVVKNVVIGSQDAKPVLKLNTTIETKVSDLGANSIEVTAAKIFDSSTRKVTQENVDVGTLSINTTNDPDKITLANLGVFIIEGANVNVTINKTNDDYDFLGIKMGNNVTLKSQLTGSWTHTTSTSTWNNQALSDDVYNMTPVMLERWYTTETTNRTIEVEVDEGLDARLVHADIGYSYTLADDIFSSGSDPLYAGNWKVVVESASVTNYTVTVEIYTATDNVTYGEGETFNIDSTITKVVIRVKAVTA